MIQQGQKEKIIFIIKEIESDPQATQRAIAQKVGISLGQTNYLIKELIKKGLIEVKNFSSNNSKLRKLNYILTKQGFDHKLQLMRHFLKVKESEYNLIKQELEQLAAEA